MTNYHGDTPGQALTGDPDVVHNGAQEYQNIADMINRAHKTLTEIKDGDSDLHGEVFTALKSVAGSVADDVYKAYDRYNKSADALRTYSSKLRTAQDNVNALLPGINAKKTSAAKATKAYYSSSGDPSSSSSSSSSDDDPEQTMTNANNAYQDAIGDDSPWAQDWSIKGNSAEDAKNVVDDVVNHHNNGLKDPGWFHRALSAVGHTIVKVAAVLKTVCDILTPILIVLAFIPGLGEFALAALAIVSVIQGICDVIKGISDGSWKEVLGGALEIGLAFGGGKLMELGLKGARGVMAGRVLGDFKDAGSLSREVGGVKASLKKIYDTNSLRKLPIGNLKKLRPDAVDSALSKAEKAAGTLKNPKTALKAMWKLQKEGTGAEKLTEELGEGTYSAVKDGKEIVTSVKQLKNISAAARELESKYPGIASSVTKYKIAFGAGATLQTVATGHEIFDKGKEVLPDLVHGDLAGAGKALIPEGAKAAYEGVGEAREDITSLIGKL